MGRVEWVGILGGRDGRMGVRERDGGEGRKPKGDSVVIIQRRYAREASVLAHTGNKYLTVRPYISRCST